MPITVLEDDYIVDNNNSDKEEEEEEEDEDNDDTTIIGTSEHTAALSTVATSITIPYVFTVSASLGSLSILALPILGVFSQDTSILIDETIHYSRSDVPLSELKLGL